MSRHRRFIVFGHPRIEAPEIAEVTACLKSGWLGSGPRALRFENMFRRHRRSRHAVSLSSCTAALHLSLLAIGLKQGDEVVVPTMTFAATANAVIHAGGVPVLADCDRQTMNITPEHLASKISRRTKAVVVVHFAGRPCDMDGILSVARKRGLKVIEDCAHALEAKVGGRLTGTFGDLSCFSFYATKNITTGEGGMVVTDSDAYASKIRMLALHGLSSNAWQRFSREGYRHYEVLAPGFKYNMTDIQASIGIHQFPRIEKYWKRRHRLWDRYDAAFRDLPVFTPAPAPPGVRHAHHLYTLLLDLARTRYGRDRFIREMNARGVGTAVHYVALHLQPYYRKRYGYARGDFPSAEWISERTVSLPLSARLSDDEVERVIRAVRDILGRRSRSQ